MVLFLEIGGSCYSAKPGKCVTWKGTDSCWLSRKFQSVVGIVIDGTIASLVMHLVDLTVVEVLNGYINSSVLGQLCSSTM